MMIDYICLSHNKFLFCSVLLKCDIWKCVLELTYTGSLSDMASSFDSAL